MKKKLLLVISALVCSVTMWAQRNYTFNAVALNVDGLPESILGVSVNEGAPAEDGATKINAKLATSGWDICGFSEDFNYHSYLTTTPASNFYNFGTHGGSVSGLSNSTDGLGIAVSKRLTMGDESKVAWEVHYGETSDGSDGLINKGYRTYTVTFATGVAIDVYVLHMDAGDGTGDIDARAQQLEILANAVITKAANNKRPAIVIGDTNCRYTRDQLKTLFIDAINAESALTVKDAWVEKVYSGTYPEFGAESMMWYNAPYNNNTGEVVDKVFYVNTTASNLTLEANSYLHDTSFTVSDHYPVIVNFTLTDKNGSAMTDAEKEENWTLEESVAGNQKPTWEGEQVVSNTSYFMMNVGTGEYIKWGGAYLTEAVGGNGGTPITPITSDNGATWVLKTSRNHVGIGDYTYLDQTGTWYLEPVSGTSYQYRLRNTNGTYLTANTSEAHHPIKSETYNASSENQKWVFLTDDRIRTEMTKANADYPMNFTALLKSADFDVIEVEDGYADNWTNFNQTDGPFKAAWVDWGQTATHVGGSAANYSTYAYSTSTDAVTMSQSLGTLPQGTYNISFEGFYRAKASQYSFSGAKDQTVAAKVNFGSVLGLDITQNTSVETTAGVDVIAPIFRDGDSYFKEGTVTLSSEQSITLEVTKPSTSYSKNKEALIAVDNFKLLYYGTGEVAVDPYLDYKNTVVAYVNATYEKVLALNAAGQAAYDISSVAYAYNNNLITTSADATALCAVVDEAYKNALAAQTASIASAVVNNGGGDMTSVIQNPSFETGDLTAWTVGTGGWDLNVYLNSNETYAATGCDGEYLFNSYGGDAGHTGSVKQTINGLPNGLYELKVLVTSFGDGEYSYKVNEETYQGTANTVFLLGNDYHKGVKVTSKKEFVDATLYFLVESGQATIGVIGGNKGPGNEFKYYWPWEGCFFKADNFRLSYVCDVPHGRLKLALDEANAANLDEYGQAALNISSYESMYNNKSLTSDGKAEAAAVRSALQSAAKAQKTVNADMTYAITNPNFETGDYTGWTCSTGGDTKAAAQENWTYAVAGSDGRYLFNTWADGSTAQALTQTVTGLANGTYTLTAMVASDSGNNIKLTANGVSTTIPTNTANSLAVYPTVECEVTDGTMNIEVVGVNNIWYKADDFRLTYLGRELVLNEGEAASFDDGWYTKVTLNRTVKANTWSTIVFPFAIPEVGDWEVMKLSGATQKGNVMSMTFDKQTAVEAGVPYVVRHTGGTTVFEMANVDVTATLKPTTVSSVTFTPTYTPGTVPKGSFFLNNNTFYQAANDKNTLKAFRGYFTVDESAPVNGLQFIIDGEVTAIEGVNAETTEEIVAIYSLDGRRVESLVKGVNIVKLSNGKTRKVIVK